MVSHTPNVTFHNATEIVVLKNLLMMWIKMQTDFSFPVELSAEVYRETHKFLSFPCLRLERWRNQS